MSYKSNIWKMYLFKFFRNLHFIGGVLVPFYTDWAGITFTQIMILNSIFVFSIFLMEVPTGAVADYFGRKTSLVCAAIVTSLGILIYSFVPNFYLFILGEFLWGTGFALMSGADEALVYDSLKKVKKVKDAKIIFGRFNSFEVGAIMIAAPIGSYIASSLGLRYTMLFMFFPMILSAGIGLTFKEPKTKKKVESKRYFKILVSGIKYFKNHKELKILAFDRISISIFIFMIIWLYQPLLKELGLNIVYFGFVHAAIAGIQIVFMVKQRSVEMFFGSNRGYLLYGTLITAAAFILLGFSRSVEGAIVLILVISAFGLPRHFVFQTYLNRYIESHNRSTVISTISMIDRFCRAVTYPLIGLLVESSLRYAFFFIGGVLILFSIISKVEEEHLIG